MAPPATARSTLDLSGWMRSAVPDVRIDARTQDRTRRDRVVDAAMYLFASLGAVALADTWTLHPPWFRVPDLAVGLVALAALNWRRTHPAAVGLFTAAASMVVIAASGAALVATFNAAVRARGLHLAYVVVLSVASCFTIPLLYPGGNGYWVAAGIGLLCTGYALSKRLQRWRSIVAWSSGQAGSFNVAPPTWTKSVTKNRLLAAGYYGARRVGMEVFAADTMRTLMAALMVHDLHALPDTRSQADTHPEERIGSGAVHGGYWRRPYDLHSTLVYTGLLGLPEAYVPKLR